VTFSIGIRTVFRPQNYCRNTVVRLAESGTLSHPSVLGLHVHHGEVLNPNMNGVGALRAAARDNPDWVVFLEDDIDIINDFINSLQAWLDAFARDDVFFYPLGSFYAGITQSRRAYGFWEMPLHLYYGSQAVAFRTHDALHYAHWLDEHQGDTTPEWSQWRFDQHFDMHLAMWQRMVGGNNEITITPSPCFVDHVGENSIMGTWERTGRMLDFAGRDWSFCGRELERS